MVMHAVSLSGGQIVELNIKFSSNEVLSTKPSDMLVAKEGPYAYYAAALTTPYGQPTGLKLDPPISLTRVTIRLALPASQPANAQPTPHI